MSEFNPPWSVHPQKDLPLDVFIQKLELLNLKGIVSSTRHWDYKRVFIAPKDNDKLRLGRACIYQGYFSHIKWYGSSDLKEPYMWNMLMKFGEIPTDEDWLEAVDRSKIRADKLHEERLKSHAAKVIWAKNTPRPNGKPRKRPKTPQYPGKHRFIFDELGAIMQDKEINRSTVQ